MKTQVRDFWNARPCVADWSLEERNSKFPDELSFMMRNMPFESALDVGCGTGFEPINYKLKGCERVAGIDMSGKSLEIARAREQRVLGRNGAIEWHMGDAEALPFGDGEFEYVSAIGSLHHTPDTERAIMELERVASKEIVVMLYNYRWMMAWRIRHAMAKPNYDNGCPLVKWYRRDEVRGLFNQMPRVPAPFHVTELQTLGFDRTFGIGRSMDMGWAWYVRAQI